MKTAIILLISTLSFISCSIHAQQRWDIKDKIMTSDSILIVSHDQYWLNSTPGKSAIHRKLIVEDRPNKEIVKQKSKIELQSRNALFELFRKMKRDSLFEQASCFNPHQAILFFERGICSYLDICFGCRVYGQSEDLAYDENLLHSDEAFDDLKKFFIIRGVNFRINE